MLSIIIYPKQLGKKLSFMTWEIERIRYLLIFTNSKLYSI